MIDSRTTHTLQDFIASKNSNNLSYNSLSFIDKNYNIDFVVTNIIRDYLYELKKLSEVVTLNEMEIYTYSFNPKLLANRLYGNPELGFLILMLNDLCNLKEFTLSTGKVRLIKEGILSTVLPQIYNAEKNSLQLYNNK